MSMDFPPSALPPLQDDDLRRLQKQAQELPKKEDLGDFEISFKKIGSKKELHLTKIVWYKLLHKYLFGPSAKDSHQRIVNIAYVAQAAERHLANAPQLAPTTFAVATALTKLLEKHVEVTGENTTSSAASRVLAQLQSTSVAKMDEIHTAILSLNTKPMNEVIEAVMRVETKFLSLGKNQNEIAKNPELTKLEEPLRQFLNALQDRLKRDLMTPPTPPPTKMELERLKEQVASIPIQQEPKTIKLLQYAIAVAALRETSSSLKIDSQPLAKILTEITPPMRFLLSNYNEIKKLCPQLNTQLQTMFLNLVNRLERASKNKEVLNGPQLTQLTALCNDLLSRLRIPPDTMTRLGPSIAKLRNTGKGQTGILNLNPTKKASQPQAPVTAKAEAQKPELSLESPEGLKEAQSRLPQSAPLIVSEKTPFSKQMENLIGSLLPRGENLAFRMSKIPDEKRADLQQALIIKLRETNSAEIQVRLQAISDALEKSLREKPIKQP